MSIYCEQFGDMIVLSVEDLCSTADVIKAAKQSVIAAGPDANVRYFVLEDQGGRLEFTPDGLRDLSQFPASCTGVNSGWLLIVNDPWCNELVRLMTVYGSVWSDTPIVFTSRTEAEQWVAARSARQSTPDATVHASS